MLVEITEKKKEVMNRNIQSIDLREKGEGGVYSTLGGKGKEGLLSQEKGRGRKRKGRCGCLQRRIRRSGLGRIQCKSLSG